MAEWLVIGIGSEFRGDDAVGCIVVRNLKHAFSSNVRTIEHQGDGATLLQYFRQKNRIILVDAVQSNKKPGIIHRLDLLNEPIPSNFIHNSSHLFGVAEALALARVLSQLPSKLLLFGIEANSFEIGNPLSKEVERSVDIVSRRIIEEVEKNNPADRIRGKK